MRSVKRVRSKRLNTCRSLTIVPLVELAPLTPHPPAYLVCTLYDLAMIFVLHTTPCT
jgi:hypothetical protein